MRNIRTRVITASLAASVTAYMAGCTNSGVIEETSAPVVDVDHIVAVADVLTGSFSSEAQSLADERFFDIRLRAARIWPEIDDGSVWLYVEQAVGTAMDRPYRQRVYELVAGSAGSPYDVESRVYTLAEPAAFIGAFDDPERFASMTPAVLAEREGCSIYLVHDGLTGYTGATQGDGCSSQLGEASYATSLVILTPETLVTWDRGWTPADEQAWGSDAGPYVFDRID